MAMSIIGTQIKTTIQKALSSSWRRVCAFPIAMHLQINMLMQNGITNIAIPSAIIVVGPSTCKTPLQSLARSAILRKNAAFPAQNAACMILRLALVFCGDIPRYFL